MPIPLHDPLIAERLRSVITTLPPVERNAVLLFYADELTAEEVSAVLDLSPIEVDRVLNRFRARVGIAAATALACRAAA